MPEFSPKHLVMIRHGESEGDVRRALQKQTSSGKHPVDEEQTILGNKQSVAAGKWVANYVLGSYNIQYFDVCATSPTIRTKQSAASLGLSQEWTDDPLLTERNRGKIQGLARTEHQSLFPESYAEMNKYPFHWTPPNGESILRVVDRATKFLAKVKSANNVLVQTHRDWIWASHIPLEGLSIEEALSINTDEIKNAQILHYTNVDPLDGSIRNESFRWKRSVCPCSEPEVLIQASNQWTEINSR